MAATVRAPRSGLWPAQNRRALLRGTKRAWTPAPLQEEGQRGSDSKSDNLKRDSIRKWLDSGFFSSANEDLTEATDQTGESRETGTNLAIVGGSLSEQEILQASAKGQRSISKWLELWQKDPEEILLNLGFGADEPDVCTRIPVRFLRCHSSARGINMRVFLEAQKTRFDIESPELCERFRQLDILDHVTSVFSSLLNDTGAPGQGEGEEEEEERRVQEAPREGQRRTGQVLRRVSNRLTRLALSQGPPETPTGRQGGANFSGRHLLASLAEKRCPTVMEEAGDRGAWCRTIPKPLVLSPPPNTPGGPKATPRDQALSEPSLPLPPAFRTISRHGSKPPDSFEMEEIQSFEEETGISPDFFSGAAGPGVTRACSCQSDSSGFLEEPLESFSLRNPSALGGGNLSCSDGRKLASLYPDSEQPRAVSQVAGVPSPSTALGSTRDTRGSPPPSSGPRVRGEKSFLLTEQGDALFRAKENPLACPARDGTLVGRVQDGHLDIKANPGFQLLPCPVVDGKDERGLVISYYDCFLGFTVAQVIGAKEEYPPPEEEGKSSPTHLPQRNPGSWMGKGGGEASPGQEVHSLPVSDIFLVPDSPPPTSPLKAAGSGNPWQHFTSPTGAIQTPEGAEFGPPGNPGPAASSNPNLPTPETGAFVPDPDQTPTPIRSVTIQMPSRLVSVVHDGPRRSERAPGPAVGGRGSGNPTETRDKATQTEKHVPGGARCPNSRPHHLPRSISLDSGTPGVTACVPCPGLGARQGYRNHCSRHHGPTAWPGPEPLCHLGHRCPRCDHLEMQLAESLHILRETAVPEISPDTAAMKNLCQTFREQLDEADRHFTLQQAVFAGAAEAERREEWRCLQALRQAVRQEVAELEFQLNDRARLARDGILMLEQLLEEQSRLLATLHLPDWREESEAQIRAPPSEISGPAGVSGKQLGASGSPNPASGHSPPEGRGVEEPAHPPPAAGPGPRPSPDPWGRPSGGQEISGPVRNREGPPQSPAQGEENVQESVWS
ncbi:protein ITPRID1 isoform X2 [Ornithorhynchus anatinus]|uniref:protein ITPRID1 isoform X2 n=1 Tax=Ornithorhynchus anatinus TaxID=9258 RepID=UPI0010A831CF|nr:protein ITPRID1 isoform X2 [Ornithorhynchus anatinus]